MTRIRFDGRDPCRSPLSPLSRAPVRSPGVHPTPRGRRSRRVGARAGMDPTRCAPGWTTPASTSAPTPARERGDLAEFADAALAGGVDIIQLRDKGPDGPLEARAELAALEVLAEACARHGALLAVNDRADIALAAGADVLHLGQDDLPVEWARRIVGRRRGDRPLGAQRGRDGGGRGRGRRRLLLHRPVLADPDQTRPPAPGLELVRTVASRDRPGRGSPSAGSTTPGWTRCWPPARAGRRGAGDHRGRGPAGRRGCRSGTDYVADRLSCRALRRVWSSGAPRPTSWTRAPSWSPPGGTGLGRRLGGA